MFHVDYKPITDKLPPSILEWAYNQLLSQKRNPISPDQIIEKHDQIENHLRNALEVYEKYKACNRKKLTINRQSKVNCQDMITQNSDPVESTLKDMEQLLDTKYPVSQNKSPNITYTEEEFNACLKEETDALRLKFIEVSKKKILEISNAIARKNSVLGIETMKSWIRDGSIYSRIYALEIEDGKDYSDRKNRGA